MIAGRPLDEIVRSLFALPDLELQPGMRFTDIHGWDSLSYINQIFGVEQRFSMRFTDDELDRVRELQTVGELEAFIDSKRSGG